MWTARACAPICILDPLREEFLACCPNMSMTIRWDVIGRGSRMRWSSTNSWKPWSSALATSVVADSTCSATTLRRRRDEWIRLGVWDRLRLARLDAYDRLIGLDLADLAVDGCTTKAPCGGECAGRSPVDRAKGGLERSQLTDGAGVPIATVSAPANTVDHQLLPATLDALKDFQPLPAQVTVHLDAGYDYRPRREALAERGLTVRSHTAAHRRRSRSVADGWSSAPTPASTTSASCVAAPNAAKTALTPTSPSPPPS
jgi:hypothetical protein